MDGAGEGVNVLTGQRNPRQIPEMVFLEDIESALAKHKCTIEELLQSLQTMFSKYRLMETSVTENRDRLKRKLPDIASSLECVKMLQAKKESGEVVETFYNLADQVYTKARVVPEDKVALWLGANVMVEYTYDEAETLLQDNVAQAEAKMKEYEEDLSYLRGQKITTEVNMARAYNYDLRMRKLAKAAAAAAAGNGEAQSGAAAAGV